MEKELVIWWNNFTWGISDQKYQTQTGRYYRGFWVDTRRFDVTPTKLNELLYTFEDNIKAVFNQSILWGSDNIIWLQDGRIYLENTLKKTLATGQYWTNIWYMKIWGVRKLYYFNDANPSFSGSKYIHRSNLDWAVFDEWYRTYVSTDWDDYYHPKMSIINEAERILFSHANNVFEIDKAEVVTKLISFPSNENVIWITTFQWEYRVYTCTWSWVKSDLYIWDWESYIADNSIGLNWVAFNSVVNKWAYDYASTATGIYKFAGTQYIVEYYWINVTLLGKIWEDIYLEYNVWDNNSLAIYWNTPWYPVGITPKYTIDNSDFTRSCELVVNSGTNIYYATGREFYEIQWTATTWILTTYIESTVFIGDNPRYEKTIEYVDFKFSHTTANCYIVLEATINETLTWWTTWDPVWIKLWEGKNWDISTTNHGLKINKNIFLNPVWMFNTIRFKVSFVSNWATNCKFYGLDVFGKQDIWK